MKKRINPRRKPATQADVKKAKLEAAHEATSLAMALIFTALLDGGHLEPEELFAAWKRVQYLTDSVDKGYVNIFELRKVLREEYRIEI